MAVKIEEKDGVMIYRRPSRKGPRDLWRAWQVLRRRYLLRIRLMTRRLGAGYVFCRPQGGWNDTLVQVSLCLDYALRYHRRLIIDTSRSGLLDVLARYFRPASTFRGIAFSVPEGFADHSRSMSCLPASLTGRGVRYESEYREETNYVEALSRQRLTFDMNRHHVEQLLVHEQCGGGGDSRRFFDWAVPTKEVRTEIEKSLHKLPLAYFAVHIRHTDRKTKYKEFLAAVQPLVAGKNILVCTDSFEVLTFARETFGGSRIFSAGDIPDSRGQSLHHNPGLTDWRVNVGALCDLAAMSGAEAILRPSASLGFQSGFVDLAISLMNRQLRRRR